MQVHFFGKLGDRIGRAVELDLPPDIGRIGELRRFLAATYPDAAAELAANASRACVADTMVGEDHRLGTGDVVEFFPPLSGG